MFISVPREEAELETLAQRCITYVSMPYTVDDRTLLIGIAPAEANDTSETLFRKADLALYSAKTKRGTARLLAPEMRLAAASRQLLEHDLHRLLSNSVLRNEAAQGSSRNTPPPTSRT